MSSSQVPRDGPSDRGTRASGRAKVEPDVRRLGQVIEPLRHGDSIWFPPLSSFARYPRDVQDAQHPTRSGEHPPRLEALGRDANLVSTLRSRSWERVSRTLFDVAILGGGISGASLFHHLSQRGYRVLLLDKGDFACGTSQASGMTIWGGLLYLRNLDVRSVVRLSKDREMLARDMPAWVRPRTFRFVPSRESAWGEYLVHTALYLYWGLGRFRRRRPRREAVFEESALLAQLPSGRSLVFEEATLNASDSRFVLQWIVRHQSDDDVPLNHAVVEEGRFDARDRLWYLEVGDAFDHRSVTARARCVVNATGAWTDRVNERFGIRTPYKHVFSKGVYLGLDRLEQHRDPLVLEIEEHRDIITLMPWGPLSLWGPTEAAVPRAEDGFAVTPEDVDLLLKMARRKLRRSMAKGDVVSLRCGLRPLAVNRDYSSSRYPLDLSRDYRLWDDPGVPWISVYGGKLTNCTSLARGITARITRRIGPARSSGCSTPRVLPEPQWDRFPGVREPVPSLDWCMRHEYCCTLEDYLRRRTNISQWVAREGLGRTGEHRTHVRNLSLLLSGGSNASADRALGAYEAGVRRRFDDVLEAV